MAAVRGLVGYVLGLFLGSSLAIAAMAGSQTEAQVPFRVGVIVPLSGPLAVEGQEALAAITDELKRSRAEVVVVDDRGAPDGAVLAVDKLLRGERVSVVIGPLGLGATEAVARKSDPGSATIVSLAVAPRDVALRFGRASPSVVTFSSVTSRQREALAEFSRHLHPRRLGLVSFGQATFSYADEIASALGSSLPRHEAPMRGPLSRVDDVADFRVRAEKAGVELILGALAEPIAEELIRELRHSNARTSAIVFSPPSVSQRARTAARLLSDAAAGGSDPRTILRRIQSSRLFDRDFHSIALSWKLAEYRSTFSKAPSRESTDTHSCTCHSSDGLVARQCDCLKDEKCESSVSSDTCKVSCKR